MPGSHGRPRLHKKISRSGPHRRIQHGLPAFGISRAGQSVYTLPHGRVSAFQHTLKCNSNFGRHFRDCPGSGNPTRSAGRQSLREMGLQHESRLRFVRDQGRTDRLQAWLRDGRSRPRHPHHAGNRLPRRFHFQAVYRGGDRIIGAGREDYTRRRSPQIHPRTS